MFQNILRAVSLTLSSNFPNHRIYTEKIEQGLLKPCFFISLNPVANEFTGKLRREKSLFIDVVFFSENGTNLENYMMADDLGALFQFLTVDGKQFMCRKQRYEIVDGLLHFLFDLDITEFFVDADGEKIQEIYINKEVR